MGDREEFLQIFQQHVTRPGSEKLLDWLDNTRRVLCHSFQIQHNGNPTIVL